MEFEISVVLPTHNPRTSYLTETLAALQAQTLPLARWELIIVDNRSEPPVEGRFDLSWHPHARVVVEPQLGLTRALLCGFHAAQADIIVTVADDNVLAPNYFEEVVRLLASHPRLGIIGGNAFPRFDVEPAPWVAEFHNLLALKNVPGEPVIVDPPVQAYPSCAPLGAGMVLRRETALKYAAEVEQSALRSSLDRAGKSLASSGDNDMILTALKHGYSIGHFPSLSFVHLMPPARTTVDYLSRLQRAMMKTFVQMLHIHGLCPWAAIPPWTLPFRLARGWLRTRPWSGPSARIAWARVAGQLEGQAAIAGNSGRETAG
ncbi:MAG: glycosyltransferase [Verrucomicrobia bacterium]|nr:glycosyltransferase [Verrucomicrobiota bacterium]